MAVVNSPSVRGSPPKRSALMAGNSATGSANTVADRSARNAPASTWLCRMNRIPSATARGPSRGRSPGGRSVGSRPTPYSAAA